MRYLTLFCIPLMLACVTPPPVVGTKVKSVEGIYKLPVTMKTKTGNETVNIYTETAGLCQWIQKKGQQYGNWASVTAVGECHKEGEYELQKSVSQRTNR